MKFDIDDAIQMANQAVSHSAHRSLTDVEVMVLKGAWQRQEYDQIAAKHQYATSYISQDVAPKLWKILTEALGEKVKKSNFKQVLERYWKQHQVSQAFANPISPAQNPYFPNQKQLESFTPDYYVERSPLESTCYQTLLQPGALVRIKAPSLMGKTLLVNRVLAKLATQGYRTASLSFKLADSQSHFTHLDKLLRWFCINLSRELGLANALDDYWDEEDMGSKVSCTTYFEDYLLASGNNPIALCLDDVHLLFPYPEIYEDFFGLLRSWYEKARSRQRWQLLRLIIVHSTDVYIRLNINQSPFNVGLPIELADFTLEQIQEFAQNYGLKPDLSYLQPLINMIGGHPYLVERAFTHLKNDPNMPLDQLLATAPTDAGIYASHLRENWLYLQSHPQLAEAFKTVVTTKTPVQVEPMQAYQLHSIGLVKRSGNQVEPRCNLYRQYFCHH
ncbi:AAA-like domain-containing protein [Coleofasciculus sp. G2-EDA-02]|uniref:AAA-like domain-containing protein n=1 Tax=Coleofasciculus sp. G2-EDA-02 TaxID=3069529 RepID=UPI00330480FB